MGFLDRNDIGIDLGTTRTLIYVPKRGIVLEEPSVAAVDKSTGALTAVGQAAYEMLGREKPGIASIRPLSGGVISNFDIAARLIQRFLKQTIGRRLFFRPRAVVSMPSRVTEAEKRCIVEAVLEGGARYCYLIEEPIAAAIGAGVDVLSAKGTMVVDIGGGTSDLAVISSGSVVLSGSIRVAGNAMDAAIAQYVFQKHGLLIGERSAEQLKFEHGRAFPEKEQTVFSISGKSIKTGLNESVPVGSNEFIDATIEPVKQIVECIRDLYDRLPPELAKDIAADGILLTGGGAQLQGLAAYITEKLKLPCRVAPDSLRSVALGLGRVLEESRTYHQAITTYRRGDYLNA